MRDLIVFAIVMLALPAGFRSPFTGLLLFSWLAYMRPQDLCWSLARGMRFSFFAGVVMIAGWLAHESHVRRFWRPDIRTVAMLLMAVLITISTLPARAGFEDQYVSRYYFEFVKIIVVALFTTGQVDSRQRLRVLLWTICLCLGFYGFKGGVIGILTGGNPILRGPGGMLEDNNDFALALVMNIPLLFYLGRNEGKLWIRRATDVGVILTLVTILLTHSRGGFLAVVATLLLMAWRSRRLTTAISGLVLMAALFYLLTPTHVMDRIASIGQAGEESSAGARLHSWAVARRMIVANPVLGVGLRNFQKHFADHAETWDPGHSFAFVAHNSYLQIWAEGGTLTFVVYLGLLLSVFVACRRLRHIGALRPDLAWVGAYARMMEATTVGFLVGATFLNRGHFDLIYHWFALVSCLLFIAQRELAAGAPSHAGGAPQIEVRWRNSPFGQLLPRWGR